MKNQFFTIEGILCIRMDTIQANGELKPMMASSSTQCSNMYISKPNAGGLVPNTIVDNQQQNGGASGNNGSGFVPHLSKLTPDVNSTSINQQTSSTANQPFNPLSNGQFDTVSTHSFLIFDQNTFEVRILYLIRLNFNTIRFYCFTMLYHHHNRFELLF